MLAADLYDITVFSSDMGGQQAGLRLELGPVQPNPVG